MNRRIYGLMTNDLKLKRKFNYQRLRYRAPELMAEYETWCMENKKAICDASLRQFISSYTADDEKGPHAFASALINEALNIETVAEHEIYSRSSKDMLYFVAIYVGMPWIYTCEMLDLMRSKKQFDNALGLILSEIFVRPKEDFGLDYHNISD